MSSITRRFSAVLANSTASGTPSLLISGWPLSCSCTSTRMNPDRSQSGRCACRLDQLNPHDLARTRITADEAQLAPGRIVEHCRVVPRRRAGLARADDQLPAQQLLE